MPRVDVTKNEWEKRADRMIEWFDEKKAAEASKMKSSNIVTEEDTRQKLIYLKRVPRDELGEYGLEVPEWDDGRDEFSVWRREKTGEYVLVAPKMQYGEYQECRRQVSVEQGVYFNHLPEGFRQFKNKREARAYIQRHHPGNDLNL